MRLGESWYGRLRASTGSRGFLSERDEVGPVGYVLEMQSVADELTALHARVCKGIADPKRLLILNALRGGERSVMELCDDLGLPQANVSQHLAVLRDRGLVCTRRDAQRVFYSLTSVKIVEAIDLLREVMAEQAGSGSESRAAGR